MSFLDRLLTIAVTATLTSAAWIVMGGTLMERAQGGSLAGNASPAETAPGPASTTGGGLAVAPSPRIAEQDSANATAPTDLMIPVQGVPASDLSDTFADARGGGERLHEALDIMAPEGTGIVSAAPGTVERLFLSEAGGKTIYVRSDDRRTIYYYAHLKDYATDLKEGQKVRRGQNLGTVGYTGNASPDAPHLHFAVMRTTPSAQWWEPATALNPYPMLAARK